MTRQPEYDNMTVFEQVLTGLKQGIAHARGQITLKTTVVIAPAPRLSKTRICRIRKRLAMSQAVFAAYLNVPVKTLQSWEQGARVPKAGEARLLQMFETAPDRVLRIMNRAG